MKTIIVILLSLIAAISLASAYTLEQQTTIDGVRLSFKLGQAYEKVLRGESPTTFNALVDQWNAWVVKNFGQDPKLDHAEEDRPGEPAGTLYPGQQHHIEGYSPSNRRHEQGGWGELHDQ